MKLNIFLFVAVAGVASFVSWQYVDQFGWTLNHTGVNAGIAASWGGFGDYIGGIMNPIVAGLGLIFFIITLKQNEKALKMSAEELRLTRKELREASAAQRELAEIERENLDTSKFMRDYESCQKAESIISTTLDGIMAESVEISWHSFVEDQPEFELSRMINGHGRQFIFLPMEGRADLERLKLVVARYIAQLDNLYQVFERQNKISKKLNILYTSKLKGDVDKFNNRILNAKSITLNEAKEGVLLIDIPLFNELLSMHLKFVVENAAVLT